MFIRCWLADLVVTVALVQVEAFEWDEWATAQRRRKSVCLLGLLLKKKLSNYEIILDSVGREEKFKLS